MPMAKIFISVFYCIPFAKVIKKAENAKLSSFFRIFAAETKI
jgi:hypothetical protein